MKTLTGWFPAGTKPVHPGVYRTAMRMYPDTGYSYWNGKKWSNQAGRIDWAYEIRHLTYGTDQRKAWQGLAHPWAEPVRAVKRSQARSNPQGWW
jgi:hypothetical protein